MIARFRSIVHKPWLGWLLRLAFSGLLLALLFTQIDLASVFAGLSLVDPQWLVAILALYCVMTYCYAYQMSLLLQHLGMRFANLRLFAIILISTYYSLILPGSVVAGGAISWYKISRSNRRRAEVGALLIYVRLIDTLVLLGIGLVGVWFDPHFSSLRFKAMVGAMFAGVLLVASPFFFPAVTRRMEQIGQPLVDRLSLPQPVQDKAGSVWTALKAFQALDKRTIALVFGLSLASHVLGVVLYYLLALTINMHLSILVIGWVRSLVGILQLIPFSVAGLGVREVSVVLLLRQYGISESQALTFSLAIFGVMVMSGLMGGALEAWDILISRHRTEGIEGKTRPDADAQPNKTGEDDSS